MNDVLNKHDVQEESNSDLGNLNHQEQPIVLEEIEQIFIQKPAITCGGYNL